MVVVDRQTKLVCRWFVEQSRKTKTSNNNNNYARGGGGGGGGGRRATTTTPTQTSSSPSKVLSEPDAADGREAMAGLYKSWQLLRLPLCREAMAELVSGRPRRGHGGKKKKASSSSTSASSVLARKNTTVAATTTTTASSSSSAPRRTARQAAARLIHVLDDSPPSSSSSNGSSGDNYHSEGALPPCGGNVRVLALVAVDQTSWPSSADVANVLVTNLPGDGDVDGDGDGDEFYGFLGARATPSRSTRGFSSSSSSSPDDDSYKGDFTTVHVVFQDMEMALKQSPFPKPYPTSSSSNNNNNDNKGNGDNTATAAAEKVSIDDGFYSSYRQYCALQQRAWELANAASSAGMEWTTYESIGESFAVGTRKQNLNLFSFIV